MCIGDNVNSNMEIRTNDDDLKAFERRIQSLERRVGEIESRLHPVVEDQIALYLTIPDSLRKSLFAVSELSKATADEVCIRTGRHRSIENKYLNELVRSGWLKRERIGKKVYYSSKKRKEEESPEVIGSIDELDKKLEKILG
jgi:regulator of replication initiation timing